MFKHRILFVCLAFHYLYKLNVFFQVKSKILVKIKTFKIYVINLNTDKILYFLLGENLRTFKIEVFKT